jgi:hypothetical protein
MRKAKTNHMVLQDFSRLISFLMYQVYNKYYLLRTPCGRITAAPVLWGRLLDCLAKGFELSRKVGQVETNAAGMLWECRWNVLGMLQKCIPK